MIFAVPEIAAVGPTAVGGRRADIDVASAEIDLTESIARPWTYETEPSGTLGVLTDRQRQVAYRRWAVALLAGEWDPLGRRRHPSGDSPRRALLPGRPVLHVRRGVPPGPRSLRPR